MDPTRTTDPQAAHGRPSSTPSSDHGRFAPGAMLGDRYRIVALLGAGGMGEVYRADDLKLAQPVALKFLPEGIEHDRGRLDRFLGEIRIARQVSHPNVCRVYDVAEIDGRHFLSMEYIDGEDLASLLRRIGRLPPDKGLDIARQICAGLAASHDRGVLHRDLKPANVMLDGRGKARITDFGLAGALEEFGGGAEVAGTPMYMAPEQLAGEPLSVQTDLYALGLLLFEVFTGRRVHDTSSLAELRERHKKTAPEALSSRSGDLDPAIERVIERCLERDPRRRPASAMTIAAALPGGDPLAAALAAGETPSPQMVAAAGEEGALTPKVAVAALAAIILLLPVAAWLTGRSTYLTYVRMDYPPQVLAHTARQMLERLGHSGGSADNASGFTRHFDLPEWIEKNDQSLDRWRQLDRALPPAVGFWYRTSPTSLRPLRFLGADGHTGASRVTPDDPPRLESSAFVELHPDGRLVRFEAVPGITQNSEQRTQNKELTKTEDADNARQVAWQRVFAEAGLDLQRFSPATPEWLPPVYADARSAWTGPPDNPLRVEAASYLGLPVFFRVIAPWTQRDDSRPAPRKGARVIGTAIVVFFVTIIATTIVLARRNIRLGRGDRRGARTFAWASGILLFTSAMLSSDHVASGAEIAIVLMALSWVLFVGVFVWLVYIAVEPYVRRRWPQVLISWTRLMSGGWRDPLVGKELLLGALIGIVLLVLSRLATLLSAWRGVPPARPPFPRWEALESLAGALGEIPHHVTEDAFVALMLLALLFVTRTIVRHERAALVVFVGAAAAIAIPGAHDPVVDIPFTVLFLGASVAVVTRLGLLAFWSATYVLSVWGDFQPKLPVSDFPAAIMILAVIALLAPAVFGFHTSLAGRSILPARLLED